MPDREKVIRGLKCIKGDLVLCVDCEYSDDNGHGGYHCKAFCANDAIALLKEQPEIVRCKDCKYWHETIYDTPKWMPCMSVQTSGNWFCADGERKESK